MKRLISATAVLACLGLIAQAWSQDKESVPNENDSLNSTSVKSQILKCSPPKFMVIEKVDSKKNTVMGFFSVVLHEPKPVIYGTFRMLKLSDLSFTNARQKPIADDDLKNLEGKLVVLSEGKGPLSAAYLDLFAEDTIVVSVLPETRK